MNVLDLLAVLIAGAVSVYVYYRVPQLYILAKPVPIILLLITTVSLTPVIEPYRNTIFLGLCFSLIGDLFLLKKDRFFTLVLISFLVAHLIYILAFLTIPISQVHVWIPAGFGILGFVLFIALKAGLKKKLFPVLL